MENYLMGINEYNILSIIFPRQYFSIEKLEARMSASFDIFYDETKLKQEKELFLELTNTLCKKLKNWKKYKPTRGLIEDFFKVCKDAFGLGKFHSFTQKSMRKNIYLCLLLSALVVEQGFKTKTQLQKLSEGIIDYDTTEPKKNKKSKKSKEKTENKTVGEETNPQSTLKVKIRKQVKLDYF